MSLPPPRLDFGSNTYLTVYLSPTSPYISDPHSINGIHPALTHIGPVGAMRDVHIASVSKNEWQRISDEVLASFDTKAADVIRVEVQEDPTKRVKRGIAIQMSCFASPTFLSHLKSLHPESAHANPWYIVAAVGFAACNRPEAIPVVFDYAMKEIEGNSQGDKLMLVRRLRDAIFKAGLISGYPKAINALKSLFDVTPEELRDSKTLRDTTLSPSQLDEQGRISFRKTYGDSADAVQSLLDTIYPDMGWFSNTIGYGVVYSFEDVLTATEVSYVLCAALIASDVPRQIEWHLKGARSKGATLDEIKAVRTMAIEVAKECGLVWRNSIPDIESNP